MADAWGYPAQVHQRLLRSGIQLQLGLTSEACIPVVDHEHHLPHVTVQLSSQTVYEGDEDACRLYRHTLKLIGNNEVVRHGQELYQSCLRQIAWCVEQHNGILSFELHRLDSHILCVGHIERAHLVRHFRFGVLLYVALTLGHK